MLSVKAMLPKVRVVLPQAKTAIHDPYFVIRVITFITLTGLVFYAPPVLADAGGIGGVVATMIEGITGIIQTIAVGAGVLGLSIWAIGKVVRPYFPQVSGMTSNYIPDLLVGVAVVFVASEIVQGLADALGGG